jgi:hypothetical protein
MNLLFVEEDAVEGAPGGIDDESGGGEQTDCKYDESGGETDGNGDARGGDEDVFSDEDEDDFHRKLLGRLVTSISNLKKSLNKHLNKPVLEIFVLFWLTESRALSCRLLNTMDLQTPMKRILIVFGRRADGAVAPQLAKFF